MCAHCDSTRLYAADLDALTGGEPQVEVLRRILQAMPALEFWVDAGFADLAAAQQLRERVGPGAERIVTIFASNTEMVAALGLTDRIVGIEAFTRYPAEVLGKPLVGGRLGFSVDAVVARKPDLVVVTPSRQAANQLIDPMERLGIPIVVLLQRNVEEILSNIRLLARLAGVPERGEALAARLQARLDAVGRRVAGLAAPSVVMITGRLGNGLMLVTRPGTYTGDAIVRAGGRLAFDSGTAPDSRACTTSTSRCRACS